MGHKVYLNGELAESSSASVSVSNPALLHGVGLFETLRAYNSVPFRLKEHLERVAASAKKLDMPVDSLIEQVPDAISQVLQANQLSNARIRFTLAPPSPQDAASEPTLLVAAQETGGYPRELYEQGMTAWACTDYRQSKMDPLAGHKTTCYFPRLIALRDAQNHRCGEALWFTPENLLAEGSMTNVFLVSDNTIKTPPVDTPILPGVTRAVVIELAQQLGVQLQETACTVDDLLDADEVFLTNSVMEIMPVTRVERHAIGSEKAGPLTSRLSEAYTMLVQDTCRHETS
jgi:branched-subunit amino acid aminotransferase/4-amino-4-deoxychorismate lyase